MDKKSIIIVRRFIFCLILFNVALDAKIGQAQSFVSPIENRQTTQAYAAYGKVTPGKYHTGMDITQQGVDVYNYTTSAKAARPGKVHKIFGLYIPGNNLRRWNPATNTYNWEPAPAAYNQTGGDNHGLGICIIIYHPDLQLYTLYGHLDAVVTGLAVGSNVTSGQVIGRMGNSYKQYLRRCPSGKICPIPSDAPPQTIISDADGFGPHLHFEVKDRGVLSARKADDDGPDWGYTSGSTGTNMPGHPNWFGYHNPNIFLNLTVQKFTEPAPVEILQMPLSVRDYPSADPNLSLVITSISQRNDDKLPAFVAMRSAGNQWYQIYLPNAQSEGWSASGWVEGNSGSIQYSRITNTLPQVRVMSQSARVYEQASTSSSTLAYIYGENLADQQRFVPFITTTGWYKVYMPQKSPQIDGWISANNVQLIDGEKKSHIYSLSQGLNLIAFSFNPKPARFSDLMASLGSDLLPYVFFINDKGNLDYQRTQDLDAAAKKGYFLYLQNPRQLTITGDPVDRGIILRHSLNLVGVTERVTPPNNSNVIPIAVSIERNIPKTTPLFEGVLEPGIGYFIYSYLDGNVLLPSQTSTSLITMRSSTIEESVIAKKNAPPGASAISGVDFVADFKATQQGAPSSITLKFGIKPGASDGYDANLDTLRDIPLPGQMVGFFDEGFGFKGSYKSDGNSKEWPVVITSQMKGFGTSDNLNPVRLTWTIPSSGAVPPDARFELLDGNRNVIVSDMRSTTNTSFIVNGPGTEKRYIIKMSVNPQPECYSLTTSVNPSGAGTLSINTSQNCSGGYKRNTAIPLTATPNQGYVFNQWSGSGGTFADPKSPTTTFTIIGNASVTASFTPNFWQPTGSGPSDVYSFAVNSQNHIFAATSSGGVFRSTDNGKSWVPINTGLTNTQVLSLSINSSGDIFAGTGGGGIFRLTKNDSSWTHVWPNSYIRSLAINSLGHIFGGIDGGSILRSTQNGDNWDSFGVGSSGASVISLAVNSKGDIFAGTDGDGIFLSTDKGVSWTPVNSRLTYKYVWALAINSTGHIFAGTNDGGVFRSTDNGANWTPVNTGLAELPNRTVLALAINSEDDIFAGTYSGVFQSTDNAASWTKINSGLTNTYTRSLNIGSNGYVFAGTEGGVFRSVKSTHPCYSLTTTVNPIEWGTVTVETPSDCSENYPLGTSIHLTAIPNSGYTFNGWTGSGGTFANPSAATTTFTITGAAVVTANFKANVILLPAAAAYGKIPGGDQTHPDKVTYSFAGLAGDVYLSFQVYDVAANEVNVFLNNVKVRTIAPTADNQWGGNRGVLLPDAMVKDAQNNIVVFDNAQNPPQALNWGVRQVAAERCISLPATPAYGKIHGGDQTHVDKVVYCISGRAGDLIVNYEVYDVDYDYELDIYFNGSKVRDEAITGDMKWSSQRTLILKDAQVNNTGINVLIFTNTKNPPNTWFWGVRNVSLAPASAFTAAADSAQSLARAAIDEADLPPSFHLAKNFPNPFNPATAIRFSLPAAAKVKLTIYNVRGEVVRELVNGEMPVGDHEVIFNAGGMASGTYYYRLEAGAFTATRTMTLTK